MYSYHPFSFSSSLVSLPVLVSMAVKTPALPLGKARVSPCVHCCQDTCPTIGESQGQSLCSLLSRHMPYHWGKPGSVLVFTVVKTHALPLGKARVSPCVHGCQNTCPTIGESQGQSLCSLSLRHMPYHWGKPGSVLVSTVVKTHALPLGKARVSPCVHGCQNTCPTIGESQGQSLCSLSRRHMPYHWGKPGSVLVSMAVKTHALPLGKARVSPCVHCCQDTSYHWGKPGSVLVSIIPKTHALPIPLGTAGVSPFVFYYQCTRLTTMESHGQSLCLCSQGTCLTTRPPMQLHLIGLVVKASTLGAEDPRFKSRLRQDFSKLCHASDFKIGTPVATLSGAWRYRVSSGTGWPGVSILWLDEMESWICNFSVWQHVKLSEQIRP